ncbi:group II intron reverse transcriptase/maturase [Vallitalea guaymasensis]|uniref:group II intron reverse transcriptase/maturase n=1 Tax=Vallitalea guaymasensis TaxID=1185412 RepID=UPI00293926DD|nr:group II intron reverse transcriptase/maturase [Vallitalea guaymasensis]
MKTTNHGAKNRKLHKKDYLQMVSTESKEYVEVLIHEKIAENNHLITDFQDAELLEKILERNNLNKAYKKVKSNKGSGGIDKMSVDELLTFLRDNKTTLLKQIREGKYKPNPVRRVEIPKEEKGKVRKLGIPTVVDRVMQQAITGVLSPIYEKQFSEDSYGFRPNKSAHGALKKCCKNVDEGYAYVVDMDLDKFFDMVCQSKLIEILSRTIKDNRVISLIHKYLNAGVINNGMFEKTEKGVPQGGPLSPLLSNIMLNELDKELTKRGHRYVRYADDLMIFCKSKRGATRVLKSIIVFIEKKLFLKVNSDKTVIAHVSKVKFLGYTFYRYKGKCRLRLHKKSINKMKRRLKELTKKNNGWGNEYRILKLKQYIIGWLNYFKLADMKTSLKRIDEWLRRRIRAIYWKQWKKVKTRYKMIKKIQHTRMESS